jgi:N6-L-threonylcarbamoyladenine synthase
MNVLGIESSCDETSVAVISNGELKANLISSQDFHIEYGGVVPELSSRAHLQRINPLVKDALIKAQLNLNEIDLIAATAGPGLIGALLVGFTYAKGLTFSLKKAFVPVNHIEGHIFSGFLMEEKPEYPVLTIVVSGGHTLLLITESPTQIKLLGTSIDDAAGEAFDKVAKMIGFGYPGGPKIQIAASNGNKNAINFPVAELKQPYHFSFSGLKTAVLRYIQESRKEGELSEGQLNDIAASFQYAIVRALSRQVKKAIQNFPIKSISLVGGVAANKAIREEIFNLGEKYKLKVVIPSYEFCGDNAAMIALRGQMLYEAGERFSLDSPPFPSMKSKYFI